MQVHIVFNNDQLENKKYSPLKIELSNKIHKYLSGKPSTAKRSKKLRQKYSLVHSKKRHKKHENLVNFH